MHVPDARLRDDADERQRDRPHQEDIRCRPRRRAARTTSASCCRPKPSRASGSWNTLVRVVAFEMVGYSLGYRCHVEDALDEGRFVVT